jgi:hypothetical protein
MAWFQDAGLRIYPLSQVNEKKITFHRQSNRRQFNGWTGGEIAAMYKTPYPAHRTTNDHASTTIIIQRPFVQELTKLYNHVGVENFIEMRNERALLRNKKKTAAHDKRIAELTAAIDKATSLRKSGDSFFKLMAALPRLSNATHTHRHECDDPGNCPDCKKRPRVKKDCAFWAKKRRGWCEPTNDGCTWTGILAGYLEHLYDTRPTHDQETGTGKGAGGGGESGRKQSGRQWEKARWCAWGCSLHAWCASAS